MNLDKLLKIFVPTDHAFFPFFIADAQNLVKAAEQLEILVSNKSNEEREEISAGIKKIEHIGDEITNTIFNQLNKSFITPFDREDIHQLAFNIDNVVDSINSISRRICLYKPHVLHPTFIEMANLIVKASNIINSIIFNLEHALDKKLIIIEACRDIKEIENQADDIYFKGILDIFENESEAIEVIKNNKILENMERCIDEIEDVTDIVKTILIKMT